MLLALTGYGTPHLTDRLAAGTEPLLHYAGLFALRPRSADRLGALISDWLGMRVEVVEFAGAWLPLPPDQRTRLSAQRRLVPARASMPRPACGPGTRRRASSCASARST